MDTLHNEKLLAAFEIEHKEHLEFIRSYLQQSEESPQDLSPEEIQEAYRRAHSLKGAARACGLDEIEAVAHSLEEIFSECNERVVHPERGQCSIVNKALDAIEDAVVALLDGNEPTLPPEIHTEVQRLVKEQAPSGSDLVAVEEPTVAESAAEALQQRLLQAFKIERAEHLAAIRSHLEIDETESEPQSESVEEIYRRAHSLKGAARACGLETLESMAFRIEGLFARIREKTLDLDANVLAVVNGLLDSIEGGTTSPAAAGNAGIEEALLAADGILSPAPELSGAKSPKDQGKTESSGEPPEKSGPSRAPDRAPVTPAKSVGTLRVQTGHLDAILDATGQLLTECLQQGQVGRQLKDMESEIGELAKEWDRVRETAAGNLRLLVANPRLACVGKYLELVETRVRSLARQTRILKRVQRTGTWRLQRLGHELQSDLRQARMTPVESVFNGFRKMVRDLAKDEGKDVEFRSTGFQLLADRMVLDSLKDPVMHILRNAISHGLESPEERRRKGKDPAGRLRLQVDVLGNRLWLRIEDDGRGLNTRRIASEAAKRGLAPESALAQLGPEEIVDFVFQPGFSTSGSVTDLCGRGMGLSVVQEAVTRLHGSVSFEQKDRPGTTIIVEVPVAVSTHRLLLVSCGGSTFAIPAHAVERLIRLHRNEVQNVDEDPIIVVDDRIYSLTSLARLLKLDTEGIRADGDHISLVFLRSGAKRIPVVVDSFLAEMDAIVKDLDPPASRVKAFVGALVLPDGGVALVLNPAEIVESSGSVRGFQELQTCDDEKENSQARVLVVDDSFTTRTLETSILETHGFSVEVATDGIDALSKLRSTEIDLVISDIEMPRLDGFGLLEEIKSDRVLREIPVILVSSLHRREAQQRGLDLGADAYIVKSKFDHQELLDTIEQIL